LTAHRHGWRFRAAAVAALVALGSAAARAEAPVGDGWIEAVLSVRDLQRSERFYTSIGGWERLAEGELSGEERAQWALPPGERARWILLREPRARRGHVRLVEYAGRAGLQPLRAHARTWEPGGFAGLNVRIRAFDALLPRVLAEGWQAHSAPVAFRLQQFTVVESMLVDENGVTLTPIERRDPPLAGWTLGDGLSRPFNAFVVVTDFAAARRFYVDGLGFASVRRQSGPLGPAGPNIFGLPYDLVPTVGRRLEWFHPRGGAASEGTVAVMAFDNLRGAEHARGATPHALGLVALRLPVEDVYAVARRLAGAGFGHAAPRALDLAPYGRVCLLSVVAPGGEWWDIYSRAAPSAGGRERDDSPGQRC
jgi:catechol 2,3-dioxygenase-like lactoylglutathione lyase family enzyme